MLYNVNSTEHRQTSSWWIVEH